MQIASGAVLPVQQCWELGRLWYADRLGSEWKPKTADIIHGIFEEVGLTGEFWRVD